MGGYTPPATLIQGQLVTPEIWNKEVRDNVGAVAPRGLIVQMTTPGGGDLTAGQVVYAEIPYAMTITGWSLIADQVGSIVIDVWRRAFASFPPTIADTIAGSEKPTIVTARKGQNLALLTWAGDVDAGDVLAFSIDSATDVQVITLTLRAIPR